MTTKESKVVAWQWEYFVKHSFGGGYWVTDCDNEYPQVLHQSDLKDRSKYRNITPLVPESALQAAEAELGELRRRVGLAVSMLKVTLNYFETEEPHPILEADINETIEQLLASDGGADGGNTNEESK